MKDNAYIFTDGASTIKGDFYESATGVVMKTDSFTKTIAKYHKDGTVSLAELFGMKTSIELAYEYLKTHPESTVYIITDSEYVLKSVTKWIYGWAKSNWIKSTGEEVKYADIFKYLYDNYLNKSIKNKNVKFYHINSHIVNVSNARRRFQYDNNIDCTPEEFEFLVKGNEEADKLAVYSKKSKTDFSKCIINIHERKTI